MHKKNKILFTIISLFVLIILIPTIFCGNQKGVYSENNTKSADERTGEIDIGIFNGCGIDGLADKVRLKIQREGYKVVKVDNWKDKKGNDDFSVRVSQVMYANPRFREDAEQLAQMLSIRFVDFRPDLMPSYLDIALLIGKDFEGDMDEETEKMCENWSNAYVLFTPPPEGFTDGVLIDISNHSITLVRNGEVEKQYPCATGIDNPTPTGKYTITVKLIDPTWYWEGRAIPPGPENGLGTRFLGISLKGYGIHGTNEPESIGRDASHGCIRMYNEDIEELYELVKVGDIVLIQE